MIPTMGELIAMNKAGILSAITVKALDNSKAITLIFLLSHSVLCSYCIWYTSTVSKFDFDFEIGNTHFYTLLFIVSSTFPSVDIF